ncbi:hypothetical protein Tco_1389851 [Tanacetum coccineum]
MLRKSFNFLSVVTLNNRGDVESQSILYVDAGTPMGKEDIVSPKTKNIKLYVKRVNFVCIDHVNASTERDMVVARRCIGMGTRRAWIKFSGGRASPGSMTQNCISDLKPDAEGKILEAKVYRKWIYRSPPKPAVTDYCCIMIDKEVGKYNPGEHRHTRYPLLQFTSPRRRGISCVRDNQIQNDHSPLLFPEESQEEKKQKKRIMGKLYPAPIP